MDKNNLNISKIENYMYSILDNVVSDNTFAYPPETMKDSWNDVCVIDVASQIRDYDSYGKGTVFIWLLARPLANGTKNVARLSEMETTLNEVIDSASDSTYRINRRGAYAGYDKSRKWHYNMVELNIIIV